MTLLISSQLPAQTVEELQRRLTEKEKENQQLRQRIMTLEREITPSRIEQTRRGQVAIQQEEEESNRALERALVREGGLLLSPGTREVEANFAYSYREGDSSQFRRHSFGPALVFRAGLPWRSQIEASLPYVFERRRDGTVSTDSDGIGDFTIGLSHQLLNERASAPALIGAIQYMASTGKNTIFESTRPVAHGTGFDSIQGSLAALKRFDPLVIFGNYSFTHTFSENKGGMKVDLGNSHGLRFGTALATGPDTSLRAALSMTFFEKTRFGGVPIPGTDDALGILELGGSAVLNGSMALDILLGIGLTSNAPDFRVTAALPIRF
ncbi:hypothetical protein D3878_19555 [Noviherbaspirillum sedimenti]|uniref:Uncharacterized protein n=2 Tax=Noviherbaspirillum sedimenti TaxID=2320865 RepID=A0A3A3GRD7_9BURK|nr:hypothetical protein D3878_19555 [Noviherbaspirillum sedimenti]